LGSGTALASLPDNRVYEPVSPVATEGNASVYVRSAGARYLTSSTEHGIYTTYPFEVAPDGEAVTYAGDPPPTGGSGSTGAGEGNEYVATREPGVGWRAVDVEKSGSEGAEGKYLAFSPDLSVGVFDTGSLQGVESFFLHATSSGESQDFVPLSKASPALRTASEFNRWLMYAGGNAGGGGVAAASHELFEANDALIPGDGGPEVELKEDVKGTVEEQHALGAEVEKLNGEGRRSEAHEKEALEEGKKAAEVLYDSVAGQPLLVSVLPDGQADVDATFGSFSPHGLGHVPGLTNVISADGSRIFWTAGGALRGTGEGETPLKSPKALYVREDDTRAQSPLGGVSGEECTVPADACTVEVDASGLPGTRREKAEKGGAGTFLAASSDGSKVFFTDEKPLTADSTAAAGEPDLYECELPSENGEPCRLTDLTPAAGAGHADVKGVLGVSDDGSYVYFAAGGVLAANESDGQKAVAGSCEVGADLSEQEEEALGGIPLGRACNLYVSHAGEAPRFIATVPAADDGESTDAPLVPFDGFGEGNESGDWQAAASRRTAEVTPDGGSLVFMSDRSLTGYDNDQTAFNSFEGRDITYALDEVFTYEAGGGILRCVSCNPSGEPPVATHYNDYRPTFGTPVGGFIPIEDAVPPDGYRAQPRVISDSGARVFFDSGEPLVPQDTNGWVGVYEWERDGAGTCTVSSGCVYLISNGQDPEASYLIGASESGGDVFFLTRAQLVAQDRNDNMDVYDAHECTTVSPCLQEAAAAECAGTGCQGVPAAPPIFETPASITFSGVGNYPPPPPPTVVKPKPTKCKKGDAKNKKEHCVPKKKKRKKTKAKKSSRAANDRRTRR
jgi:hypothetical protein